jgi:hypothetical protein
MTAQGCKSVAIKKSNGNSDDDFIPEEEDKIDESFPIIIRKTEKRES